MSQHFELLLITPVKLDQKGHEGIVKKIEELITSSGGVIGKKEEWGSKKLAYEIQHQQNGIYDLMEFDLDGDLLKKIDSSIRLIPDILRYMIVRKKVKTEKEIAEEKRVQEKIAARKIAATKEEEEAQQAVEEKEKEEKVATIKKAPKEKEVEKPKSKEAKISLDDLDKKLDEILTDDI